MLCSIQDLCEKDVINSKTGCRLGPVCDVELDLETGRLVSLLIFNRQSLLRLASREQDIRIRWEDIDVIGEDTILVCDDNLHEPARLPERRKVWDTLFR